MTQEDWFGGVRRMRDGLPGFIEDLSVILPETALTDIRDRIQETGQDAGGQPLKPYSPGYLQYKQSIGRYTGKTDLTLTTRMWNNTGVIVKQVSEDGFLVTIGGRSEETQAKLDANSQRYGDVLEMSEGEEENLALDFDEELQRYVNNHLGEDDA